ncbi:MAG: hypothetical protein JWO80_4420 [Bryobacterales bacterium]|nr:hypothetical protein [Bryobacterales bacterium]
MTKLACNSGHDCVVSPKLLGFEGHAAIAAFFGADSRMSGHINYFFAKPSRNCAMIG